MKTYPDEALNLPSQTCRRRSLPRLPSMHLNNCSARGNDHRSPIISVTDTPATQRNFHQIQHRERRNSHIGNLSMPWNGDTTNQPAPNRPPRPSLQLQLDSPDSIDQFEAFKSQHVYLPCQAPQVMLEFPSEESSRRPSRCSGLSGFTSPSPFFSNQLPPDLLQPALYERRLHRRASDTGNLGQTAHHRVSPVQPFLNVPRTRSRGSSLPEKISSSELYMLRNFATSGKRVINKGDSYRSRNSSINSSRSSLDNLDGHPFIPGPPLSHNGSSRSGSHQSSRTGSQARSRRSSMRSHKQSSYDSLGEHSIYRVLMLGAEGVGKSSLCSQFLSSEHINTYATVEDSVEKDVVLAVNGQECRISFIDHPHGEMKVENMMQTYSPHAILVVMAVDDLYSLQLAEHILLYLAHSGSIEEKAVILVANKADLVRNREIKTAAGKELAVKSSVKYIETSPGINHNIDELLVGIFSQICLRLEVERRKEMQPLKLGSFLGSLLRRGGMAKSCSNLNVI